MVDHPRGEPALQILLERLRIRRPCEVLHLEGVFLEIIELEHGPAVGEVELFVLRLELSICVQLADVLQAEIDRLLG